MPNDTNKRNAHAGIRQFMGEDVNSDRAKRRKIEEGMSDLELVRTAFPRQENEKSMPYARRLNLASQQNQLGACVQSQPLSIAQLASLSGVTESRLCQDPQLVALPADLMLVCTAFPREENEKSIPYARRLNLASQQNQPGARIQGQPLSIAQFASLSGAMESKLRQDPQFVALPTDLMPVRTAFPREENEKSLPYARRLNLASQQILPGARVQGQPLSIAQLASLSGVTESRLCQDPQLVALPADLAQVRIAFPREENEKSVQYARRLNLASQQNQPGARVQGQPLSIPQLASLSGAMENNLRQDPQLVALPAELVPVRTTLPREENEKSLPYARRLNLASQQNQPGARVQGQPLSIAQLASLSGATKSDLRRDAQLVALPTDLAPVRTAFPREENEKSIQYARRLNLASQQNQPGTRVQGQPLSIAQLASLSGTIESELRRDSQLVALPADLVPVHTAFPREENEKSIPYARRLNLASQQNQLGAHVQGQPLSIAQLASLSGVTESRLRQDPQLVALPVELAPIRAAFPREENEKSLPYARRLNLASQQNRLGSRVQGQPLGVAQLASLSGAMESGLRRDPQLVALPAELAPVRTAFPRKESEKSLQYARRLNLASQQNLPGARVQGQPLSIAQLASLSGASQANLRLDPQLVALPADLVPVRTAFPRAENEKSIPYAKRLNLASQQNWPGARVRGQPLSFAQLASLSGAMESGLRRTLRFL